MSPVRLHVVSGLAAGTVIDVADELVLGRASPDPGRLGGDSEISRRHAVLRQANGVLSVEDLGSTNGTYVNDRRITGAVQLVDGTRLRLGRTTIEVRAATTGGGPAQASPAAAAARGAADEPTPAIPAPRAARAPDAGGRTPPAPSRSPAAPVEQRGSPSAIRAIPKEALRAARATPPAAELLHEGRRVPIPDGGLAIGSEDGPGRLRIAAAGVAPDHARVVPSDGRFYVADLGGGGGTELNGELLNGESRWLNSGDAIVVGGEQIRFTTGEAAGGLAAAVEVGGVLPERIPVPTGRFTIGRDPSNNLVIKDPNVSRFHAEVARSDGRAELRDLGSRNGTRVNGQRVTRTALLPGHEVGVGAFRLVFDGDAFVRRDDHGALRMRVRDLTISVKGKRILNRAVLGVEPGEFTVIIGGSGTGKSTLIKAMAGVNRPAEGEITVNAEPLESRLTDIGYVPQDEIVHGHLTTLEALRYAAKLRLPRDLSEADVDEAIERVLEELDLKPHANTLIRSLSGGQRKRAGMATELLSRPSILLLDEPTTGLDPGLETRMMELFRELAEPGVRAVVVVTHATKNLGLADRIVVMGAGGEVTFVGPPDEAKRFFDVDNFDGIYTALDERPATEWRAMFEARRGNGSGAASGIRRAARTERRPRPRAGRQATTLIARYARLITRDRRNLAILLAQAPLIGFAVAIVFKTGVLDGPGEGLPRDAAQLMFLLVTTAIWLGSIDGSREIIKERALAEREAAVGVRWSAYLLSKAAVLFTLSFIQLVILAAAVFVLRPLGDASAMTYLAVVFALGLTSWVAVGMGLLVSASVDSEDQATSFIPLVLIPQLLFAGALVAVEQMSTPVAALSNLVFSRWAYQTVGGAIDLNARINADPEFGAANPYGDTFFALSLPAGSLILLAFLAVFFAAVGIQLVRSRT